MQAFALCAHEGLGRVTSAERWHDALLWSLLPLTVGLAAAGVAFRLRARGRPLLAGALAGLMSLVFVAGELNFVGGQLRQAGWGPRVAAKRLLLEAQAALEEEAAEAGGLYPPRVDWLATWRKRQGFVPVTPYVPMRFGFFWPHADFAQANAVAVPKGLVGASAVARGAAPSPAGTRIGSGHFPSSDVYDALTYGAMLYDVAPERDAYVLYVVGREGRHAVVLDRRATPHEAAP